MRRMPILFAFLLLTIAAAPADLHAAVRGTLMTEEGAPIEGASVNVFRLETPRESLARWTSEDPKREPLASGRSDAKGKFSLPLDAPGVFDVFIEAPGHLPEIVRATSEMDLGAIPLPAGESFRGTVVADGKPVGDARIIVGAGEQVLTSGEDGSFQLTISASNAPRVRVFHPDYAMIDVPPGRASRLSRLQLGRGATIRGRVVDAKDQPVAGATLSVDGRSYGESGEDGSFTIRNLPAAWTELSAIEGAHIATASRLSSRSEYRLRLNPGASVSGLLRNAKSGSGEGGVPVALSPVQSPFRRTAALDTVVTDAKGRFSFGPLPPGRYSLAATSPALARGEAEVSVKAGEQAMENIVVEPLAILTGTVMDQQGDAVAAAKITASARSRGEGPMPPPAALRGGGAWSDPGGTFILRTAAESPELDLEAVRRGHPAGRTDAKAAAGETTSGIRIRIPRGVEVTGRVTDLRGTPLRAARVRFTASQDGGSRFVMRRIMGAAGVDPEVIHTDANGRFVASLEARRYDVVVERDGYAAETLSSLQVRSGMDPIEVQMTEGVAISGRVLRADGSGVPDVSITVAADTRAFSEAIVTGPDGGFIVPDLRPGPVNLMAFSLENNIREMKMVEAPANDVVIKLPETGGIRGRVVEKSTGRPVTNFEVGPSGERRSGGMVMMGPSNLRRFQSDDGSFELDNIPPGTLELLVQAPGFVNGKMPGVEVKGGEVTEGVEIPLEAGTRITGRVLGSDGRPVSGAIVRRIDRENERIPGRGEMPARTNAEGAYELDGVAEGEHEIQASHSGSIPDTRRVKVSGREMQLDFRLQRGIDVEGMVVSDVGVPIAGADVYARSASASAGRSARTDANGSFRMSGLEEGRYTFRASKDGLVPATVNDVAVGSGAPIRIEMRSGGTVTGRVFGAEPSQIPSIRVMASGGSGTVDSGVSPDGTFVIEGVPTGSVRVWAQIMTVMARRTTPEKVVEVPGGSSVAVDLEFGGGHSVRGRVTRNGAPVEGAGVTFVPKDRSQATGGGRTDAGGNYEATGLSEGDYTVNVMDVRTMSSWTDDYRVTGPARFDIDMSGTRVEGRVVHSSTSEPLDGAMVTIEATGGEQRRPTMPIRTDANGRFFFDSLAPGQYRVRAEKSGFGQELREIHVSDSPLSDLELRLAPSDGLQLRIVDARDGRSLSAYISVADAAGRAAKEGMFRPDANGIVSLSLAPGNYSAVVNATGYAPERIQFSVPGAPLAVQMHPGGTLRIDSTRTSAVQARLLDAVGQPVQRGRWDPNPTMMLRPGSTTIEGVAAGTYTLEILDEAGAARDRKQVTVQEGQTTVIAI